MTKEKFKYLKKNWKIGVHLILRTKRFGVNNNWWNDFDSIIFGWSWYKILWGIISIRPIIKNYKLMKMRACSPICFMTKEERIIMNWENKICEKCKKKHQGAYGSGRFCSKFCARSFSSSKIKISTKSAS